MNEIERQEKSHPALMPGMVVAGVEIKAPLNAKRMRVMMRRKNGIFGDFPGRDGLVGVESLFYCLSLSADELAAKYSLSTDEWDDQSAAFAESLPDGGIEEFMSFFDDEREALDAVDAEVISDEGKPMRPEQTEEHGQAMSPSLSLPVSHPAYQSPMPSQSRLSGSSSTCTQPDASTARSMNGATEETVRHCKT